ncbi:copper homeostasis protein CutC [uncultured Algibacter sp.]|uniref:copper homeostasis protein CutC n=1 Tax=uncultured Algibacter sp. TaxID=298659 RepID=UPI002618C0E6|nr:copper homeostasis protein CutC [uncultured Algibacter sp.]
MIYIKEACVESVNEAVKAEELGADRIELCKDLDVDGLTPDFSIIREVSKKVKIPMRVMIRPRTGNFVYSEDEIHLMIKQIEQCKQIGVAGVVFGVLNEDRKLDLKAINRLIKITLPMDVVIHKAIDVTPNIFESVKVLESLNQKLTILTSGGKATAEESKEDLKLLVNTVNNNIEILPAGSITKYNVEALHNFIGAKAYHGKKIVGDLN